VGAGSAVEVDEVGEGLAAAAAWAVGGRLVGEGRRNAPSYTGDLQEELYQMVKHATIPLALICNFATRGRQTKAYSIRSKKMTHSRRRPTDQNGEQPGRGQRPALCRRLSWRGCVGPHPPRCARIQERMSFLAREERRGNAAAER
jgi:hypothetical protein